LRVGFFVRTINVTGVVIWFFHFFFRRKWLPPPLRKLSQGKVEKTQAPIDPRPPLKKTGSDKRIKVSVGFVTDLV